MSLTNNRKEKMIKIDIKTTWDDEMGNIDYKPDGETFKIHTTGGFKKWDALSKLDFFTDLESWMQTEINNIHKKSSPTESFVHSYARGCPKSTDQLTADKNPVEYKKRQEVVKEIQKTMELGGKRFNNVIGFPKKKK